MYVLEARNLRKVYGEGEARVEALRGVDMGVRAGEMVAIMGRSGSGKSTLLSMLGGIDSPTSGEVLLEGIDLASLTDDQRTLMRGSGSLHLPVGSTSCRSSRRRKTFAPFGNDGGSSAEDSRRARKCSNWKHVRRAFIFSCTLPRRTATGRRGTEHGSSSGLATGVGTCWEPRPCQWPTPVSDAPQPRGPKAARSSWSPTIRCGGHGRPCVPLRGS